MDALKKVLDILYKNKQPEDLPRRVEIKSREFVTPEHKEEFDKWCKEFNVSILYKRNNEFG
jgi:hypothetical protein